MQKHYGRALWRISRQRWRDIRQPRSASPCEQRAVCAQSPSQWGTSCRTQPLLACPSAAWHSAGLRVSAERGRQRMVWWRCQRKTNICFGWYSFKCSVCKSKVTISSHYYEPRLFRESREAQNLPLAVNCVTSSLLLQLLLPSDCTNYSKFRLFCHRKLCLWKSQDNYELSLSSIMSKQISAHIPNERIVTQPHPEEGIQGSVGHALHDDHHCVACRDAEEERRENNHEGEEQHTAASVFFLYGRQ